METGYPHDTPKLSQYNENCWARCHLLISKSHQTVLAEITIAELQGNSISLQVCKVKQLTSFQPAFAFTEGYRLRS
jgi:hypothetical protein